MEDIVQRESRRPSTEARIRWVPPPTLAVLAWGGPPRHGVGQNLRPSPWSSRIALPPLARVCLLEKKKGTGCLCHVHLFFLKSPCTCPEVMDRRERMQQSHSRGLNVKGSLSGLRSVSRGTLEASVLAQLTF